MDTKHHCFDKHNLDQDQTNENESMPCHACKIATKNLPTLIQLNVNSETKVNFTLKCISHQSSNPSSHEEITSPANDRYVPSLVHQWVSPSKVDAPFVLGGVEHKGKAKPCSEDFLLVVHVEALGTTNWG